MATVGQFHTSTGSYMSMAAGNTVVLMYNPASSSGYIDSFKIRFSDYWIYSFKIGSFYYSGGVLTCRYSITVSGTWSGGAVDITGYSLYFEAGDYIGIYSGYNLYNSLNYHASYLGYGDYANSSASFSPDTLYSSYGISLYGYNAGKKINEITVGKWNSAAINKWNNQ